MRRQAHQHLREQAWEQTSDIACCRVVEAFEGEAEHAAVEMQTVSRPPYGDLAASSESDSGGVNRAQDVMLHLVSVPDVFLEGFS